MLSVSGDCLILLGPLGAEADKLLLPLVLALFLRGWLARVLGRLRLREQCPIVVHRWRLVWVLHAVGGDLVEGLEDIVRDIILNI